MVAAGSEREGWKRWNARLVEAQRDHVFLREPTVICQQVATLDELTHGRAELLALSDAALVKLFSGEDVPGVPDIQGQLELVAERSMPAFAT
jgi:hypothetical protein